MWSIDVFHGIEKYEILRKGVVLTLVLYEVNIGLPLQYIVLFSIRMQANTRYENDWPRSMNDTITTAHHVANSPIASVASQASWHVSTNTKFNRGISGATFYHLCL